MCRLPYNFQALYGYWHALLSLVFDSDIENREQCDEISTHIREFFRWLRCERLETVVAGALVHLPLKGFYISPQIVKDTAKQYSIHYLDEPLYVSISKLVREITKIHNE